MCLLGEHSKNKWSQVLRRASQREHLFTKLIPLFWRLSKAKSSFDMTNQVMNACRFIRCLDQTRGYHNTLGEKDLKKFQQLLKKNLPVGDWPTNIILNF